MELLQDGLLTHNILLVLEPLLIAPLELFGFFLENLVWYHLKAADCGFKGFLGIDDVDICECFCQLLAMDLFRWLLPLYLCLILRCVGCRDKNWLFIYDRVKRLLKALLFWLHEFDGRLLLPSNDLLAERHLMWVFEEIFLATIIDQTEALGCFGRIVV